jgi:ADP-L-glycero-D-manno-heptose 6-epimerase
MRILVTGGAGFIGSNLAKALARQSHDVTAADSFLSADFNNLIDFSGDVLTLRDHEDVDSILRLGRFDVIFHQASITGVVGAAGENFSDVPRMMRNNVETFRRLLDFAVETRSRMIFASSCSIYGRGAVPMKENQLPDPLNIYAFSKLTMERLAAQYATKLAQPAIGLRYTNVYGPGEAHKGRLASMIYQLAKQMRAGQRPKVFRAGQQQRDFVYIDDVVQSNINAVTSKAGGVYNIGAGHAWSFNDVIAELNRVLKTNLDPDYFDNPYSFTQDLTLADLTRALEQLAYRPAFDLRKGIEAYAASGKLGQ